ncbi:MAG: DUF2953 domain-containing protein [Ruminococcaceae bacterium]|nr:DUF2953 domain-containing protein [Oscillospiraceae bacterium]
MTSWQIFGIVCACIFALMLLFLAAPVTLTVAMNDEHDLRLRGRILGLSFYRYPEKRKRVRLSDYSERAIKKRQEKRNKKERSAPTLPPPDDGAPLTEKLSFATELASTVLRRSLSLAHVRVTKLTITVGSGDAATTALLYGVISPALAFLLETLEQFSHLHISRNARVGVAADFTSDRTRADIHLRFRLRVIHLIIIALHSMMKISSHHSRVSKRKAK